MKSFVKKTLILCKKENHSDSSINITSALQQTNKCDFLSGYDHKLGNISSL